MRAALVASLAFLGMVGWAPAEAALPLRGGPLAVSTYGVPGIGPRAWGMDPSDWHGLAAMPSRLVPLVGAYAAIRILGVVPISAAGRFQLALLAPEGTAPERLRGLSVAGDPGQFIVAAASRRDLGTIPISC
jgi:hypothetical protein